MYDKAPADRTGRCSVLLQEEGGGQGQGRRVVVVWQEGGRGAYSAVSNVIPLEQGNTLLLRNVPPAKCTGVLHVLFAPCLCRSQMFINDSFNLI